MNSEILRILDSIARERNIDRELLIGDLEQALVSAARKHFNSLDAEEFGCHMDRMNGDLTIWRNHFADDGTVTREDIPIERLGRIPAQTAKQVMIQRFREDERSSLLEEYSKRQGILMTGTAQRYEGGALVVQLDSRAEGFMPRSEQIPGEQFQPGDRVRCLILDVRDAGNQVKIVLSRSHPDFIRRLFEAEVPEVAERVIEIKAMAREPGFRTKLAVSSVDSKVDPVGACVGVRGSRIRNIVDELGGEKIDIVRWNESSQILLANALKPAEVEEVSLCFELGRATIIVRDDQLSLAIGKRGQNVRLAARLTGWDVDILTPVEFQKGLEILAQTILPIEGVDEDLLDRMGALGMISVFDIEEVGPDVLTQELELDADLAQRIVETCTVKAKEVAEQQQREKEEAERRKAEEEAAAEAVLGGAPAEGGEAPAAHPDEADEARAASILGGGPAEESSEDPSTIETAREAGADVPEWQKPPEAPEPPEPPEAPEAPEAPETPETPESAESAEAAETPAAPEAGEPAEAPEPAEASETETEEPTETSETLKNF